MDNLGDWLYIVFIIIAGLSGFFSSDKKKKEAARAKRQPPEHIPQRQLHPQTETPFGEKQHFPKRPNKTRPAVASPTPPAPAAYFPPAKDNQAAANRPGALSEEEPPGLPIEIDNTEELRKAIIYSEILNRKY